MCAVRRQARTIIDEDNKQYWCSDCGLKMGAQFRLNKHHKKQGPLLAKFKCPECSTWWTSMHTYCQNYQVLPQPLCQAFLLLLLIVFFIQECKRCGVEVYPFEAQYKMVGMQNQGNPTKRHMAELCEHCMSGLTCSATEAEDHAHKAKVRMTGPTQYALPITTAWPAAMLRAALVTNPWRVPSLMQYTLPLALSTTSSGTWNCADHMPLQPQTTPPLAPSTTSSGTWNCANHVPPQPQTTAPGTGSFCVLF